jgi:monoamine oxidase
MTVPVENVETLIIGGGLSGLYAARLLAGAGRPLVVLEARDRVGGRVLSRGHRGFFSDLGPSWYWPGIHPKTVRLIRRLGLRGYPQYQEGLGRFQRADGTVLTVGGFPMEPRSWRLQGGMKALVDGVCEAIPEDALRLDHPVCGIEKTGEGVLVRVGRLEQRARCRFLARRAVLALPPRLAASTILFEPDLSHDLTQAMLGTGTWMAGQAKFTALYEEPFWRRFGLSGQAFSEQGPLGEVHDGSNDREGPFGLTGFVGLPAVRRNGEDSLVEAILRQLAALFGDPALRPEAVFYQDWAREPYTATRYDQPPMLRHPPYRPPAGRTALWDGTVLFAGTETADRNGGYLEGALSAAERAVAAIQ